MSRRVLCCLVGVSVASVCCAIGAGCGFSLADSSVDGDDPIPLPGRHYDDPPDASGGGATDVETPSTPADAGDAGADASTGPKKAFVTSQTKQGRALGGLAGADLLCNQLATAKGLPGSFVAWLSVPGTNAIDRITSDGPWQRVDGQTIAETKAELASGSLKARLDKDEKGDTPTDAEDRVWTATGPNGAYVGGNDCGGWTEEGSGRVGEAEHTNGQWTSLGNESCGEVNRIYCFQQ